MALNLVNSSIGDKVRVYLDVDNLDFVTACRVENDLDRPVRVDVVPGRGNPNQNPLFKMNVAAGSAETATVPTGRRFRFSDDLTSDYSVSLTING